MGLVKTVSILCGKESEYSYTFLNRHALRECVEQTIILVAYKRGWKIHELSVQPIFLSAFRRILLFPMF